MGLNCSVQSPAVCSVLRLRASALRARPGCQYRYLWYLWVELPVPVLYKSSTRNIFLHTRLSLGDRPDSRMLVAFSSAAVFALLLSVSPSVRRLPRSALPRAAVIRATADETRAKSSLPPCFLDATNFSRAIRAHKHTRTVLSEAARIFDEAPSAECFAESITLRGDLDQELARGREAYLQAFGAVVRLNGSPLLPLRAGELHADAELCGDAVDAIKLRWRVPVRVTGLADYSSAAGGPAAAAGARAASAFGPLGGFAGLAGFEFELSGDSTYEYDTEGRIATHTLSELAVNGRRLPSSALAAWLRLFDERSPTTPVAALALLAETLQLPVDSGASPATSGDAPASAEGKSALSTVAATTGGDTGRADGTTRRRWPASGRPPPAGSLDWPLYEACHRLAAALSLQFEALLERAPDAAALASLHAENITLRSAAGGELLVQGREQYAQLLSSLTRTHVALTASPLLTQYALLCHPARCALPSDLPFHQRILA